MRNRASGSEGTMGIDDNHVPWEGGPAAMIRERYEPLDLFALVPQLQLAFEPELGALE